ncbi:hypothetical protein [Dyadobacter sp. CY326]|uniref:hypothetical protein n=1 Tax=Dyadobacter sp. CY326 TaxID=2907300 RepID=UPI001F4609EB|nr:hypothetical protein [Dyadobacter sp. CY326]MCE7066657.1 hypothetical protein [Dyadobacter sp. CY326]
MAVAIVVPSLLSEEFKQVALKGPVDPSEIVGMVKNYQERIQSASVATAQLGHEGPKIESSKEYLALVLQRKSLEMLLKQTGCGDLVALFALEGKYEKFRNTVILMGLKEGSEELLRSDDDGDFAAAEETWPIKLAVDGDPKLFDEFFKRPTNPPA